MPEIDYKDHIAFLKEIVSRATQREETVRIKDMVTGEVRTTTRSVASTPPSGGAASVVEPLLPTNAQDRKNTPLCTGVLDYFPLALAEVARVSKAGNDQHNPGQPLHWAREKSTDHADCILRHLMERGRAGTDGMRHSAQLAWRALALLQVELEEKNDLQ